MKNNRVPQDLLRGLSWRNKQRLEQILNSANGQLEGLVSNLFCLRDKTRQQFGRVIAYVSTASTNEKYALVEQLSRFLTDLTDAEVKKRLDSLENFERSYTPFEALTALRKQYDTSRAGGSTNTNAWDRMPKHQGLVDKKQDITIIKITY